jgi:hypothetical protein
MDTTRNDVLLDGNSTNRAHGMSPTSEKVLQRIMQGVKKDSDGNSAEATDKRREKKPRSPLWQIMCVGEEE